MFGKHYAAAEHLRPWERLYVEVLGTREISQRVHAVHLERILKKIPFQSLIDVGCGAGLHVLNIASKYQKAKVLGIDANQDQIHLAETLAKKNKEENCAFRLLDIETMPLGALEAVFDVALCFDVLGYFNDDGEALKIIRRLIRPGGRLILHVPIAAPDRIFERFRRIRAQDFLYRRDWYSPETILKMVTQAGFSISNLIKTFNPTTELMWELMETRHRIISNRILRALFFPVILPVLQMDGIERQKGNGLLVAAVRNEEADD